MSNKFRDNMYENFPDPNKQIEELGEQVEGYDDRIQEVDGKVGVLQELGSSPISLSTSLSERGVSVKDFGALGNSVANDTPAINSMINYIKTLDTTKVYKVIVPSGNYRITDTITFPHNVDIDMTGTFVFDLAANDRPAVVIGSSTTQSTENVYTLSVINKNQSNWSNELNVGVIIKNIYSCEVAIKKSEGFTVGVKFTADSKGVSYNNIYLGRIVANKKSLVLDAVNAGWVNENNLFGGRFAQYSTINNSSSRYGIIITSSDGSYTGNNNNVFYKPSFELGGSYLTGGAECIPVVIEYGINNYFEWCRSENSGKILMRTTGTASSNKISAGYYNPSGLSATTKPAYTDLVDDQTKSKLNYASDSFHHFINHASTRVFSSGYLPEVMTKTGTAVTAQNVHLVQAGVPTPLLTVDSPSLTLNTDNVELSGTVAGLGVFVDTINTKRFVIRRDTIKSFPGRFFFIPFDSSGNRLTDSALTNNYIVSSPGLGLTWSTAFGGSYYPSADREMDFYVGCSSSVAKVQVIFAKGSTNLKLKSFAIYTFLDEFTSVYRGV